MKTTNTTTKTTGRQRTFVAEAKTGLTIQDMILVAVLLAAGAVLKYLVGSVINIGGMKPNFIIAMYCLAILLIKPKIREAVIIGLLAGAVCQFFPGSPYINFISELLGAVTMAATVLIPMQMGRLNLKPVVSTFLSTLVSGSVFTVCLFLFMGATSATMVAYVPIVLCTALLNAIIVQILYTPMRIALKKNI